MKLGAIIILSHCIKYVESIDLNGNKSSPWGGYCAIIRRCCVNKLILCGVKGIKNYVKELIDGVHINTTLQSLTVCASKEKMGRYKLMALKTIQLQTIVTIDEKVLPSTLISDNEKPTHKRVVNVKVNKDRDSECLPETIGLSNSNINDNTLCLITFGLFNNTTGKKLDLSGNNITHEGAVILSDCLKDNHTLQKLDISHNRIADIGTIAFGDCLKHKNVLKELNLSINITGMSYLSECIKYATSLEYVDLSGNLLSPWSVYCAIIRHCYVGSLTFCEDKGIKEFVKAITDSLQTNTKLQSLANIV